jgi:hypothetical protein
MRFIVASLFSVFLFVGSAQAQDFCVDLCPTSCTLTATDALAVLNAAVGLDPGMCGSSTTSTSTTTTTTSTTTSTTSTTSTTVPDTTTTTTTMPTGECNSGDPCCVEFCINHEDVRNACLVDYNECIDDGELTEQVCRVQAQSPCTF